eukprot:7718624-Alexandrium_andersonii.AAC.1
MMSSPPALTIVGSDPARAVAGSRCLSKSALERVPQCALSAARSFWGAQASRDFITVEGPFAASTFGLSGLARTIWRAREAVELLRLRRADQEVLWALA